VKAGTLRAVGITSSTRSKLFPDVQTVGETLPVRDECLVWRLGPRGTPAAILEKIGNDVKRVVNSRTWSPTC
jgi:tripartite-type tricarboxylate transporter receptor subunit TctC